MYDRLLVPVDGSDPARAAARHALELAAVHGSTVHALYVVDTGTNWLTVSKREVRESLRQLGESEGRGVLADVERLAAERNVPVVTELREGAVEGTILDYAAEHDVDLVVMGTHGREGARRRIVGSVAERVVREATVPVTTVTGATRADE